MVYPKGLKASLRLKLLKIDPILSNIYQVDDVEPTIKILDATDLYINEIDLSHLPLSESVLESQKIINEDSNTPFNLAKGPLYRLTLFMLTKEKHILLISLHHIITDEWSMQILRNQLARTYSSLILNEDPSIQLPEIEYKDYAFWDNKREIDTNQFDYWKSKLSGEIQPLNLSLDFPRPLRASFKGKRNVKELSKELSDKILKISLENKVTPFVFMLTAYFTFLYKYTGQKDILVGAPISNRNTKSLEKLIGFFVDTIVLKNRIDGANKFSELVDQVKKNTLEAFSNKDVPFDLLVKSLKPERSLSSNPFFQVMFLYNSVEEPINYGPEIKYDYTVLGAKASKFDLTLFVTERNDILTLDFEYATDLFSDVTIDRFQAYFKNMLETITSHIDLKVDEIELATAKEPNLLSYQKSSLGEQLSNFNGIHEIIEKNAKAIPNQIAVSFKSESITYLELNRKANILAKNILKNTDSKNQGIGLCVERSINMIVGLLGILKSGCAYLPIDPDYPLERIDFILEDADVDILVTQNSLQERFKSSEVNLICIDNIDDNQAGTIQDLPKVQESDIAYIIYTSGSTGKPKGVPISHRNIICSTQGRLDFYIDIPKAFLLMSSISFDSSKAGIFWTLCTGGNLVIAEKRIEQDIDDLISVFQKNSISHTLMLPSLYSVILNHPKTKEIKSINTIIVAGEVCSQELCKTHFKTLPKINLYNEYGPTEASVWCIAHKIEEESIGHSVPIGEAVAGAKIYLLDSNLKKVPKGTIGEIYIGGSGLAGSYIKRPDLDAKVYIKNPFGKGANNVLYKTGDLARFNYKDQIEFVGRSDEQVKIRGYRIELGEIEKVLNQNDSIDKAIVLVNNPNDSSAKFGDSKITPSTEDFESVLKYLPEDDLDALLESITSLGSNERNYILNKIDNRTT